MKSITLVAALVAVIPAAFGLTINTPPSILECEPTQLTWSGGVPPYFITILPGGQSGATPLEQFPAQNGTSYTWNVDLASGTSITIALKDSSGGSQYSSIVTIEPGTSASCLNSTASGSGSSGTPTTGGSAATTTGSTQQSTTSPAGSSSTPVSTGSSTHSNGAGRLGVSSAIGVAGVMGLVGAALF